MTWRWPWQKEKHPVDTGGGQAVIAARQARVQAELRLRAARARGAAVTEASESMKQTRERNHFTELIADSFDGRKR